ncbi:MAG: hypothetical protein F6K00_00310 [Leptolyngbya sp. SIOISBB]|nr:hypothetical protein [Leptolyngbya sp. SIOISBB]
MRQGKGHRITDLSFEEWLRFIFCWPEHPHGAIGGDRFTDVTLAEFDRVFTPN